MEEREGEVDVRAKDGEETSLMCGCRCCDGVGELGLGDGERLGTGVEG